MRLALVLCVLFGVAVAPSGGMGPFDETKRRCIMNNIVMWTVIGVIAFFP